MKFRAIIFALVSGILYGLIQVPIIAIQDHPEIFNNAPKHGSPYIYSHFTGILIVSTAALVIYSIFKKNSPSINPQIVLPSLLAGLMFGVAMTITIVCTEKLSQAITGPITGRKYVARFVCSIQLSKRSETELEFYQTISV